MKADRGSKRLCRCCMKARARYIFRGRVLRGRHHDLCLKCYRSERDRRQAEVLAGMLPEAA